MTADELRFAVAILERLLLTAAPQHVERLRTLLIEGRAQLEREYFFRQLAIDLQLEQLEQLAEPGAVGAFADQVESAIRQRRAVWP